MKIIIKYKLPSWTIWNSITVYCHEEADNWVASLQSEGYQVERY